MELRLATMLVKYSHACHLMLVPPGE